MSTKEEAMHRAYIHAEEDWRVAAYAAVNRLARKQRDLTTDDVWEAIPANVQTHEPRALGPIMALAARNGLIRKTGTWRETTRAAAHQRPVAVWASNVYGEEQP